MFTQLLDAWNDPALRHAMFVHFPVALSFVGVPFALAAALVRSRGNAPRWLALTMYVALTVCSGATKVTGEDAEDAVGGSLSEEADADLEAHESLGENLWLWSAAVSVLLAASFMDRRTVRRSAAVLAVLVSLATAERAARTADLGGRLVYAHGAGTQKDFGALFELPEDTEERADDPRIAFFREYVRPILTADCLRCHNPTRARRSGGLNLTTMAAALEGGMQGPALVPGKPEESLLISAVRWEDPELQMPSGGDKLSDEQIEALERWIAEGAAWEPLSITDR